MEMSRLTRDGTAEPVSRQPAHLHTQAESGAYLRDSFPHLHTQAESGAYYLQSMDFQREPQSKHHLYFLDCFLFTSWPTRPNPTHIANANPDPHPS